MREVAELTGDYIGFWASDPSVTFITDAQRSTRVGDVIVDPTCGAWEIQEDGYLAVEPPAPVKDRMERDGIVPQHIQMLGEWLDDARSQQTVGEVAEEEREARAQDYRDEMRADHADNRFHERIDREMTDAMVPHPDGSGSPYLPPDVKKAFDARMADHESKRDEYNRSLDRAAERGNPHHGKGRGR